MNLKQHTFPLNFLLKQWGALLFYKVGWSLPSAIPKCETEPVVGITIDNTKVHIINETTKQLVDYYI